MSSDIVYPPNSIDREEFSQKPSLLCVSPPIRQALPGDERYGCALFVGHAKLRARVVSEVEFGDDPLKMLLANMVIRSDETALEDVEEALGGIDVGVAPMIVAWPGGYGWGVRPINAAVR